MIKYNLPVDYDNLEWWEKKDVRNQYIREQGGECCYCKEPLDQVSSVSNMKFMESLFPRGFFSHPVHLHHDHSTGLTIGAVHCHCNAYLWQYKGE